MPAWVMLRVLFRRLNNIHLREKLLGSFLVFMVLPLFVLGSLAIDQFRKATLADALVQAEQTVTRLEQQTKEVLDVGLKIVGRLAVDTRLQKVLTGTYPGPLEVFQAYHDFDTFRLYRDINPDVVWIQAFGDNPGLLDNWELRPLTPEVKAQAWYQAAKAHPNQALWFHWPEPPRSDKTRLSLVRLVSFPSGESDAAVVVDLDTSRLDTVLPLEGYETLVLDPDERVIASSRGTLVGTNLRDDRLVALLGKAHPGLEAQSYEATWRGLASWVFVREIQPQGTFGTVRVVCVVQPNVLWKPADDVTLVGALVLGLGTLLALVFLAVVYGLFTNRLERLTRELPAVALGDSGQLLTVDGRDEIAALAGAFNRLLVEQRHLTEEVQASIAAKNQLERAQDEIRLKMLISQIHPHFLFNVLESIRMKAHLRGEREIASIVKLLGKRMRRNLEASGAPISLGEELENVRCYLEIEKFRLEEKLDFQLKVTGGAEAVLVPALIIEPLVENAIIHGLERRFGGGQVTVTATLNGPFLDVEVSDNGLGMTEEQQRRLLTTDDPRHVGLGNIDQRLRLTYGDEAGIRIAGAPGKGTRISFRLPVGRP